MAPPRPQRRLAQPARTRNHGRVWHVSELVRPRMAATPKSQKAPENNRCESFSTYQSLETCRRPRRRTTAASVPAQRTAVFGVRQGEVGDRKTGKPGAAPG